ncbi:LysR family transcriptional regulator ArgP [Cellulomonas fimi]|uniref:LysR family transcriptional regulator ArgP n=1 Tax=Cellulomonas fimi TaxID=1708 RepID=UPI00234CC548|nr:LysR family transcriptional regulator ArgP [Cellulomonas fimi]MDC7120698.1 LysR family transcriptional regulator ArgP [Cellulomonas fimi]
MSFDAEHLRTLATVVDEGSFDAAARALHVTPSAVSQRIRALEQQVGGVVVQRTRPCRPTAAGEVLVRLAGQVDVLARDALAELGAVAGAQPGGRRRLAVAVNADSLSTWFPAALAGLPDDVLVDLRREDQDLSAQLLRDGTVAAAVTAERHAVQGCRVRALGSMRYVALAAPAVRDRWFADPDPSPRALADALGHVPAVAFNRADGLQHAFAHQMTRERPALPLHYAPEQGAFVALLRAGLGWGMVPEQAAAAERDAGALVDVAPGRWLDVPLFWQHWALRTPTLDDLTARVLAAARALHRA